jgi:8-oxo-dGTP pyrophosphatase MutT (NUDIX family)
VSQQRTVTVDGIAWPVQGAQVAVLDAGRVLLQLRPWLPGWELPGGHCEPNEDPRAAAAREVEEETGYRIGIRALVGVYTWAGLRSAGDVLFLGAIEGGQARRSLEAWSSRMVPVEHLPRTAFPWVQQRVRDAVACAQGMPPVHRVQPVTLRHVVMFSTAWMLAPVDRWQKRRRTARP